MKPDKLTLKLLKKLFKMYGEDDEIKFYLLVNGWVYCCSLSDLEFRETGIEILIKPIGEIGGCDNEKRG